MISLTAQELVVLTDIRTDRQTDRQTNSQTDTTGNNTTLDRFDTLRGFVKITVVD